MDWQRERERERERERGWLLLHMTLVLEQTLCPRALLIVICSHEERREKKERKAIFFLPWLFLWSV